MKPRREDVQMGFTETPFPEGAHMCLIYDNDEQRDKIISRFLAAGLGRGEQVGYFADRTPPEAVRKWLREAGALIPDDGEDGPFTIYQAEAVYCPSGVFVPAEMLSRVGGCYDRAVNAGYSGARVSGEMSWALRGIPGSDRLMEYEALINTISEEHPVTPICQYDARLFDGATLLNVLKVHPLMIVQGQIVQNPYYVRPEEFLKEFKAAA